MKRKTTFYFAPLTIGESLRLLAAAAVTRLFGVSAQFPRRDRFERLWADRFRAADAIATPSARSGLFAIFQALGIGRGDEVLITGFTCEAVPESVLFNEAIPVYVDIDPQRWAMRPDAAAAITPKTRAIIIQHTFGIPAPMEPLVTLARQKGLIVIEDCALALGSKDNGRSLGSSGDASVFSFELSKTMTAGWGGLVQINRDRSLAVRLRQLRDRAGRLSRRAAARRLFQAGFSGLIYRPSVAHLADRIAGVLTRFGWFGRSATAGNGTTPPPDYVAAPADIQWGILMRQLGRLDAVVAHRRRTSQRYQMVVNRYVQKTAYPRDRDGVSLIRFPLLVKNPDEFVRRFAEAGIDVGRWFSQPVSTSLGRTMTAYAYRPGTCPHAEFVAAHIVNLPLHERMNESDISVVEQTLDRYLRDGEELL